VVMPASLGGPGTDRQTVPMLVPAPPP
jgi:hypothetical protein